MKPGIDVTSETSSQIVGGTTLAPNNTAARPSLGRKMIRLASRLQSDENLTKKASLNATAAALDYMVRLVVGFLITPMLVLGLGNFYYGAWQILMDIAGYLSPATGRPTQALKIMLANKQAVASDAEKRVYVGSALAVMGLFLPLTVILGGLTTWFIPYWLKAPPETYGQLRLATGLVIANLIVYTVGNIPQSVLEGENLGYKRMGLSAALVLVGGGFTWLAVYFKLGIAGVSAAYLVSALLTALFFFQVVRTFVPWFGAARPPLHAIRRFLGLSWWFLGWTVVLNLIVASDVAVLGFLNSTESVTTYTITKYAPEMLISIVAIVVFGIIPGLGRIIGTGDKEKACQVRNEIMALTWLIVTVLGASILLWNRTFITLWVGSEHYAGGLATLLVVVTVTQFVFIRNDANVIDLTLRLSRKVLMGMFSVTVSILAAGMMVGYFHFGIVGLVLGVIAGRAILSIDYPLMVGRFLNFPLSKQLRGIWRPMLVMAFFFVTACILGEWLPTSGWNGLRGWIAFALACGVTFLVSLALTFFLGLSNAQRNQIVKRIRIVAGLTSHKPS